MWALNPMSNVLRKEKKHRKGSDMKTELEEMFITHGVENAQQPPEAPRKVQSTSPSQHH